jgi:hypothetical protein
MPVRIQRRRAAGWRLPEGAVYVGRPTLWGNPFRIVVDQPDTFGIVSPIAVVDDTSRRPVQFHFLCRLHAATYAAGMYRTSLMVAERFPAEAALAEPWAVEIVRRLRELRGRDLACWCPVPAPGSAIPHCHADVLLDLANREPA